MREGVRGGVGDDRRHPFTASGVPHRLVGKPARFYGNSLCCLAHMADRQSPRRARISNREQRGRALRCAEREQGGTGGSPRPLRAHRQPLDCQAADSTAAILWRKKKTPYRFNGLRGFLREKANKNGIRVVYASFSDLYGRIRGAARARWTRRIISAVIPRRVFPWRVALIISSRAAAAATWPDGSHRAEEVEAHTGSYLFIQRHYETRDNFTRVVPADILTLQARFWQTTQTPKWVLQCQVIVVYPFLLQAMKQTQAVCKKKKKKTVWKTSTHDVDAHYQKLGALEEII